MHGPSCTAQLLFYDYGPSFNDFEGIILIGHAFVAVWLYRIALLLGSILLGSIIVLWLFRNVTIDNCTQIITLLWLVIIVLVG